MGGTRCSWPRSKRYWAWALRSSWWWTRLRGMDRSPRPGLGACLDFPFNSAIPAQVANVMAGNLSVRREMALAVGGFDENFVGVAYRFETEFCRRLLRAGGRVLFQPAASIHHLRTPTG